VAHAHRRAASGHPSGTVRPRLITRRSRCHGGRLERTESGFRFTQCTQSRFRYIRAGPARAIPVALHRD